MVVMASAEREPIRGSGGGAPSGGPGGRAPGGGSGGQSPPEAEKVLAFQPTTEPQNFDPFWH